MSVKIITDSTSYIPESIRQKLDITIISLNIITDTSSKREVEINLDEFYQELPLLSSIPTSSQPTPDEMLAAFKQLTDEGHDVRGIFLSSK